MWHIFNKHGFQVALANNEPCADDLAERGEFALACEPPEAGQLRADPQTKAVIIIPPAPSTWHEWDGTAWVIGTEQAAAKLAHEQEAVWEAIKNQRHNNLRGGVFVPSVKKWFHTDDASRQQYTFMRTLPALPEDMQWKTMDNSFVVMTKLLLDELSLKMLADEQAAFLAAERHRSAMLAAANPLNYDYSSGWTATYGEAV
jgi:hypothetical protein